MASNCPHPTAQRRTYYLLFLQKGIFMAKKALRKMLSVRRFHTAAFKTHIVSGISQQRIILNNKNPFKVRQHICEIET